MRFVELVISRVQSVDLTGLKEWWTGLEKIENDKTAVLAAHGGLPYDDFFLHCIRCYLVSHRADWKQPGLWMSTNLASPLAVESSSRTR